MRLLIAAALLLAPSVALAEEASAPVSPWIVTGGDPSSVKITQFGETSLGTFTGWKCKATLSTEGEPGKRADRLMVSCVKGDLMVRGGTTHREGAPAGEPVAFQISAADGSKVVRTLMFG